MTKKQLLNYIENNKWSQDVKTCECCSAYSLEVLNVAMLKQFIENNFPEEVSDNDKWKEFIGNK